MMNLNVHFKSPKKVFLIMNNHATFSLKQFGRVNHLVLQPCIWEITVCCYKCVQPLDWKTIVSFKVQCYRKLLEWVLNLIFLISTMIWETMRNVRHVSVCYSQIWRKGGSIRLYETTTWCQKTTDILECWFCHRWWMWVWKNGSSKLIGKS